MSVTSRWLCEIESASLEWEGERDALAVHNMQMLGMSQAELGEQSASELTTFIETARRVFAAKLAGATRPMLFYAWFDEMAGQLRISATVGHSWQDLPFACRLDAARDPAAVVAQLMAASTLEGIPFAEVEEVDWETSENSEHEFVLPVYWDSLA